MLSVWIFAGGSRPQPSSFCLLLAIRIGRPFRPRVRFCWYPPKHWWVVDAGSGCSGGGSSQEAGRAEVAGCRCSGVVWRGCSWFGRFPFMECYMEYYWLLITHSSFQEGSGVLWLLSIPSRISAWGLLPQRPPGGTLCDLSKLRLFWGPAGSTPLPPSHGWSHRSLPLSQIQ